MRLVRFALLPLLLLAFTTSAFASEPTKSPEEMGKEALAKWKDVLKITDAQAPQFESVMTDSYKKMADARSAAAGDKGKMKASMKSIMKDRDESLAKVLTPEQMKTYHAKMKEMSSTAKKHMKTM
jgi:Spy/CpxP family protein refolding chaperone